jgi:hypothetical protein
MNFPDGAGGRFDPFPSPGESFRRWRSSELSGFLTKTYSPPHTVQGRKPLAGRAWASGECVAYFSAPPCGFPSPSAAEA